jgi:predicted O-methyltransferase YrrM
MLDQSPVKEVLSRLYAEAKENDAALHAEEQALAAANGGVIDQKSLDSIHDRTFMAIAPEVGRLIYLLVRSRRPALVVEFGASFGISAIHVAAALRDNGIGRMITTELCTAKASRTAQHLAEAGLDDLVEIREGDAFKTLADMETIDLVLLDGWKPLYLPMLKQLEPVLSPNCLIIADDVTKLAHEMRPYLDYVRDSANGYVSSEIPLDDGLELSIR